MSKISISKLFYNVVADLLERRIAWQRISDESCSEVQSCRKKSCTIKPQNHLMSTYFWSDWNPTEQIRLWSWTSKENLFYLLHNKLNDPVLKYSTILTIGKHAYKITFGNRWNCVSCVLSLIYRQKMNARECHMGKFNTWMISILCKIHIFFSPIDYYSLETATQQLRLSSLKEDVKIYWRRLTMHKITEQLSNSMLYLV